MRGASAQLAKLIALALARGAGLLAGPRRARPRRGLAGLGFVLGALRGAYLAWVLLLALPVANRAFQLSGSHWRFRTEGSRLERWIASGWSEQKRERAEFRSIIDRFRSLGLPDQ